MINLYLSHLFCCEDLLSFKFDKGKLYHFHKIGDVELNEGIFKSSKDLSTWTNSNSLSILIKKEYRQLCEFQVHTKRNCVQCRFNLDTIILLVNNGMIKNITIKSFSLKYKYNIKVMKTYFEVEDADNYPKTKKRKIA